MDINKELLMILPKLKCKRCGHEWTPRTEDVRICPNCHSLRWDKEDIVLKNKK